MTTMQTENAKAPFQEIEKLPEKKQDKYITAMRMLFWPSRPAAGSGGRGRKRR